jgi:hypothetical protein
MYLRTSNFIFLVALLVGSLLTLPLQADRSPRGKKHHHRYPWNLVPEYGTYYYQYDQPYRTYFYPYYYYYDGYYYDYDNPNGVVFYFKPLQNSTTEKNQ